jgi:hypothetical protein
MLLALSLALLFGAAPARAEHVEITRANLESSEEGYKLASSFSFELNRALEDTINRGVPLYFTTEVEISRPRWYWFDERTLTASRTIRISYNVLTQQYHATLGGRLQQTFATLDDALAVVRQPGRWLIAERGALKPGEVYTVAVKMGLDVTQLPKPFQVNALNRSDWRFSSDWKYFLFRAE